MYISSVRALFASSKHLTLLICVHRCHWVEHLLVHTQKYSAGSQSHLPYAWLDGVRKFADLWGSWRVRCWNNIESYSQGWERLRTIWFFWLMTTVYLFKPYSLWVCDQRHSVRKAGKYFWFPFLLPSIFLLSASICEALYYVLGISGRLRDPNLMELNFSEKKQTGQEVNITQFYKHNDSRMTRSKYNGIQ